MLRVKSLGGKTTIIVCQSLKRLEIHNGFYTDKQDSLYPILKSVTSAFDLSMLRIIILLNIVPFGF